jgi:hypothetical protein
MASTQLSLIVMMMVVMVTAVVVMMVMMVMIITAIRAPVAKFYDHLRFLNPRLAVRCWRGRPDPDRCLGGGL